MEVASWAARDLKRTHLELGGKARRRVRRLSPLPDHATISAGGSRAGGALASGCFHQATVVSGLRQDDELVQDEVFGPVITVQRFSDEDEAVR